MLYGDELEWFYLFLSTNTVSTNTLVFHFLRELDKKEDVESFESVREKQKAAKINIF